MDREITIDLIRKEYPLPESDYRGELWSLALKARRKQYQYELENNSDDAMAINNALWLIMIKYLPNVAVTDDQKEYAHQLFSAVKSAKSEFSQVCHLNFRASDVIQSFYGYLMGEYFFFDYVPPESKVKEEVMDSKIGKIKRIEKPELDSNHRNDGNESCFNDAIANWFSQSWFKKSLTSPFFTLFFYACPALYFAYVSSSYLLLIFPLYCFAYAIHVYLMANDPKSKKDIELTVVGFIYIALIWIFL